VHQARYVSGVYKHFNATLKLFDKSELSQNTKVLKKMSSEVLGTSPAISGSLYPHPVVQSSRSQLEFYCLKRQKAKPGKAKVVNCRYCQYLHWEEEPHPQVQNPQPVFCTWGKPRDQTQSHQLLGIPQSHLCSSVCPFIDRPTGQD
jgi:hypothetical protein